MLLIKNNGIITVNKTKEGISINIAVLTTEDNPMSILPVTVVTKVLHGKDSRPVYHNYSHLCYVLAGNIVHKIDGNIFYQTPGTCTFIPHYTPNSIDSIESEVSPVHVHISFPDKFLTERGYDFFSSSKGIASFNGKRIPEFVCFRDDTKTKADALCRKIMREYDRHKNTNYKLLSQYLAEFLDFYISSASPKAEPLLISDNIKERSLAINKTVEYLAKNYHKQISVDELAQMALMSRRSFFRNFEQVTGTSVSQILLSLRLKATAVLLIHTDKTLDEIAKEVKLYNKSRLSSLFTKEYGMSPREYRRIVRPKELKKFPYWKRRWTWLDD